MEFVKGNSILFNDRFNEYEIEIKGLIIIFKVVNRGWKREMTLGGKNGQKGFFFFLIFFLTQFSPKDENGSKWISSGQATSAMGQKWQVGELLG